MANWKVLSEINLSRDCYFLLLEAMVEHAVRNGVADTLQQRERENMPLGVGN